MADQSHSETYSVSVGQIFEQKPHQKDGTENEKDKYFEKHKYYIVVGIEKYPSRFGNSDTRIRTASINDLYSIKRFLWNHDDTLKLEVTMATGYTELLQALSIMSGKLVQEQEDFLFDPTNYPNELLNQVLADYRTWTKSYSLLQLTTEFSLTTNGIEEAGMAEMRAAAFKHFEKIN